NFCGKAATGLASQVAPSAEPKMPTSSDSCSMMLVMASVSRKIRPAAWLTSSAGPSPLALTTVFSGTRKASIIMGDFNRGSRQAPDCRTSHIIGRWEKEVPFHLERLDKATVATMVAGMCTFLNVYSTQPLLPLLRETFHASELEVSFTVSATIFA